MLRRSRATLCAWLLLSSLAISQSRNAADLQFQTKSLQSAGIGHFYIATIVVTGGTAPLQWKVIKGKLPPGIALQPTSGILRGTPTAPGDYNFTVSVSDATHKTISANFTIKVEDYLTVRWKKGPTLDGNTLSGTVEVSNGSRDVFDQTVIIVAVNEIGKAFALGYQHFNLLPQSQQVIPYSSSLPNGHYIVNVDAVADIRARDLIRRAQLQTQQPITVNVNR
jgi:hypothetical protein